MKGDGRLGEFLSLGRERDVGTSGRGDDLSGFDMLSSLSRNGLSILAGGGGGGDGGGGGGFSLRAEARNLVGGGERAGLKVSGSGFSGFYRARPRSESGEQVALASCGALEQPLRTDVENLSPHECWRLILKLGKRWPAWNGPTLLPPSPQERSSSSGHDQVGRDSLDLLTTRALEALAQTRDRHGRPPRSMLAPKMTTQEFLRTAAAGRDPPTPSSQSAHQTLPVYVPSVSLMPAPKPGSRTAPLTIFYAGSVNVCENVPEDKARLIMLFAEKAGIKPSARATTPPASASPSASARPGEDLQLAQPSSHPAVASVEPSSSSEARSHLSTRPESDANATATEPVAPPLGVTITEGRSRQQQVPPKPLPNARKSSLARFLDSRKRPRPTTSSGSEDQPSKRLGLSDDGENLGRGKSIIDSKERSNFTITTGDAPEVRPLHDSVTK